MDTTIIGGIVRSMEDDNNWTLLLQNHPIFSKADSTLEDADASEIPFTYKPDDDHVSESTFRRQIMCMKDADMILAVNSELRMLSLGDAKQSGESQKAYKV